MEAKIFKAVNSVVYTIELYLKGKYLESVYCRYKYQAKQYCKENSITVVNPYS